MNKRKFLMGSVAGAVTLAFGISPAFASVWTPNAAGVVEVCFTSTGLPAEEAAGVTAAAAEWSKATPTLKVSAENCAADAHLVAISETTLDPGNVGVTNTLFTAENFTFAKIQFDATQVEAFGTEIGSVDDAWAMATCHEMGHALGLDHTTRTTSCMQTDVSAAVTTPDATDLATLKAMYTSTTGATVATVVDETSPTIAIDDSATADDSAVDSTGTDTTDDASVADTSTDGADDATDDSGDVAVTADTPVVEITPTTEATATAATDDTATTATTGTKAKAGKRHHMGDKHNAPWKTKGMKNPLGMTNGHKTHGHRMKAGTQQISPATVAKS